MDNLVSILKIPALNHDVKNTMLRFIQNWSIAFEAKPQLAYVGTVYKQLQNEGTLLLESNQDPPLIWPRLQVSTKGPRDCQLSYD